MIFFVEKVTNKKRKKIKHSGQSIACIILKKKFKLKALSLKKIPNVCYDYS